VAVGTEDHTLVDFFLEFFVAVTSGPADWHTSFFVVVIIENTESFLSAFTTSFSFFDFVGHPV
jgi:hypothetical protein